MRSNAIVGQRLRDARQRLRLSQSVVADFVGITRQSLAAFERGKRAPDLERLVRLANVYRITLDELVSVREDNDHEGPEFAARFNQHADLTPYDRDELLEFDKYLRSHDGIQSSVSGEFEFGLSIGAAARQWRESEDIAEEVPVPIFKILKRLRIFVRFTALEKLAGALILSDGDWPHGILINSQQPDDRQRFSAAHELGHIVLAHEARSFVSYLGRRFDQAEVQADQFAADVLMPASLLKKWSTRKVFANLQRVDEQVYLLADMFHVSYQAMCSRLAKLGAIRPGAESALSKSKPSEIAKRVRPLLRQKDEVFTIAWLRDLVEKGGFDDGTRFRNPELVRLLQEAAYEHYVSKTQEAQRADPAKNVYWSVAKWVAETYPIAST